MDSSAPKPQVSQAARPTPIMPPAPAQSRPALAASVYPCLESLDIPERDKQWITRTYSEDIVRNAIEWLLSPQTKVTTTQVQALKFACSEGLSRPVPRPKKLSVMEIVNLNFKKFEFYNGAEFFMTDEYIAFVRGNKNEKVELSKLNIYKLQALCSNFQIPLKMAA